MAGKVFVVRLGVVEQNALGALAERLERTEADVVRRLIRAEARRRRIPVETTDGGA
jgi:hypothetical protein